MKRLIAYVSGLSLVAGLSWTVAFGQNQKAPARTPQERQEDRTKRLERRDERVEKRDSKEKVDRKATEVREDVLARRIERNEKLVKRVGPLLPPGTKLADAAEGFKSEAQFFAALHASRNLGIPFKDLKAKMTGPNPMTLGQAIKTLKPTANADAEAKKAEGQAAETMK